MTSPNSINILGISIDNVPMDEAIAAVMDRLGGAQPSQVCFVNADCANIAFRDEQYRGVLGQADMVFADGSGLNIGARALGQRIMDNVNGTDMFPRLCEALADTGKGIFLLGARPGIAELVRDWVYEQYPGTVVSGLHHGYFGPAEEEEVLAQIRGSGASVLLVAFGAPQQDAWIAQHLDRLGVKVAVGVGGLFDFYSGRIPRAPRWMRRLGIEWCYRFYQEPARLWKRYVIGNPLFLARVLRQRLYTRPGTLHGKGGGRSRPERGLPAPRTSVLRASLRGAALCGPRSRAARTPTGSPRSKRASAARSGRSRTMRAIIIAPGERAGMEALTERHAAAMLPLLDRPFIQHVIELLAARGIHEFDFVLGHLPGQVEDLLGDGRRWGSRFNFHLARDPAQPYKPLVGLDLTGGCGPILLGHADRLPPLDLAAAAGQAVFCLRETDTESGDGPTRWAGWACLSAAQMADLPFEADEAGMEKHLMERVADDVGRAVVDRPPGVRSYDDLLDAQRHVLDKEFRGLMVNAHEAEEGIWLSRNVSLHPTAKLVPPVYICQDCRIDVGAQIGPYASIGDGCVLDAHATVADSVVLPGSYVGRGLELDRVIVDRNRLVNVRLGTGVTVYDDFILGNLADRHFRAWLARRVSRIAAIALLLLTSPILLLTALCLKLFRTGPVLYTREVVHLPAASDDVQWRAFKLWSFLPGTPDSSLSISDLLFRFLPALANVATGDLYFVGVAPRSRSEIAALPDDWKALYLRSKAGIVTEVYVNWGTHPTEDERYAAEAFYSVTMGMRHDFKLLLKYLLRLLGIRPRSHRAVS